MAPTYVFPFDYPHPTPPRQMRDLLGGKGANLAEMTSLLGLPVPPGFTITTEACRQSMTGNWPPDLDRQIEDALSCLEATMGRQLGDAVDPLLVSVRSGASASMPGMLDSILNLGLNRQSVVGLGRQTGDERFALDSYRRFISMYGRVVLGVDGARFEDALATELRRSSTQDPSQLGPGALRSVIAGSLDAVQHHSGAAFPEGPNEQLRGAIAAVFGSWNSPRALAYRTHEGIAHNLGTAVNVQAMVFGNRDDRSATGVAFTRNPSTGEAQPFGDVLFNAQGEDVVAGIRNTMPLADLGHRLPQVYAELTSIFARLEAHYRDMCDTEFTVEQGKLWMLQTRSGQRTGRAALRIAVEMVRDPSIGLTPAEAVARITPEHLEQVLHPEAAEGGARPLTTGLGASPGVAVGRAYFTADAAAQACERGEEVILVRSETSPEDVHGMLAAQGVLTSRGGLASHAAVIARGWGKPAVVGAKDMALGERSLVVGAIDVREGDWLSIDGTTGAVTVGQIEVVQAARPPELDVILEWAKDLQG